MSEGGANSTTVREESVDELTENRLVLVWVWPELRVDELQGAQLYLGRDDGMTLRLAGTGVSRRHAELYRQGPLYVLHDLGSTNGTWLGGRPIEHAPISPGSVLRVGGWVGVFMRCPSNVDVHFGELAPGVIGGPVLAELLRPLRRAAASSLPVLLLGDTGTGKEQLAKATHHFSRRAGHFLAVNCAALPESLAEAELFGYRKGAFTGAERASPGHFRAAHGGTLFLDEMPELSPALQAKLLRVLEDGQVVGLGESAGVQVDVRIVSASQRPLPELVAEDRLRRDLAARLSGLVLAIPPLAERRADIAVLFRRFLNEQCGGRPPRVEARLVEALCLYDWPDNVRQLKLTTHTLLAVHGHEQTLRRRHLPEHLAALTGARETASASSSPPRDRREHDLSRLKDALSTNGGNVKAAARSLGISRQRVYRLLEGAGLGSSSGNGERD